MYPFSTLSSGFHLEVNNFFAVRLYYFFHDRVLVNTLNDFHQVNISLITTFIIWCLPTFGFYFKYTNNYTKAFDIVSNATIEITFIYFVPNTFNILHILTTLIWYAFTVLFYFLFTCTIKQNSSYTHMKNRYNEDIRVHFMYLVITLYKIHNL